MINQVFSSANYSLKASLFPPLVTIIAILLLGVIVLIREKGSRVSLLYFIYTLTLGAWLVPFSIGRISENLLVAFWWGKAAHIGITLIPAALYHFTVVFLQIYPDNKRYVWGAWGVSTIFLGVILFTDVLFDSLYHYSWGYYPDYTWFSLPFLSYFFAMMICILRQYWIEYRGSVQKTTRHRRAKAFLIAFVIGYLAAFDFLPTFGVPYYPLGYVPMFILLVLVAQVIWRYRLVDITPAFAAHQIINTMSDALLVLDHEGVIRVANKASGDLFGYTEQTLAGKPVSTIIKDQQFLKKLEEVSTFGGIKNFEMSYKSENNKMVILNLSVSMLRDQSGQPVGIVSVARDVTQRKKMEDELLQAQKLESLSILAGGIAHDFNNILTGIMGNINLSMMHVDKDSKIHERLKEAEKASIRAKDLTQQLLTFSKGGKPIKKTISIGTLMEESIGFFLSGSNVKCDYLIPDNLLPVDVDEGQMSQVFHNLLMNADQAMPEGGTIHLRCQNVTYQAGNTLALNEGNYVSIYIKDEGIGILEEYLQKVFDPYFTTKQKGSGLGLSTVYSIVKKHGGTITVESGSDSGTTFHIYIPASSREIAVSDSIEQETRIGKGRILVMDDEQIVRDTAAEMLATIGCEAECVENGNEAIELYKISMDSRHPFDAVILDLTVPGGMGGKETIRKLREIDPEVRAIVSSGYSNDPVMADFRKYGFHNVIVKPYSRINLNNVLLETLKSQKTDNIEKD